MHPMHFHSATTQYQIKLCHGGSDKPHALPSILALKASAAVWQVRISQYGCRVDKPLSKNTKIVLKVRQVFFSRQSQRSPKFIHF